MIQRYTCIPTSDYDVAVVTNGTMQQVESKMIEINEKTNNELPLHSNFTYIDDFKHLLSFLKQHYTKNRKRMSNDDSSHAASKQESKFNGKVLFMFFNGVEFIQEVLSDLIDHFHMISTSPEPLDYYKLANAYFYFDSSISVSPNATPSALMQDAHLFNTIMTIANDILKKINFMVVRTRGVFIDDVQLAGDKVHPLHCMMRNFPNVERIELTSFSSLLMNDMIL